MNRFFAVCLWLLAALAGPLQAQTVVYIHTDALGSVVAETDSNRTLLERREYEPFGQQLAPAVKSGPGFTGHVQDVSTGLTYMQQRYYDPTIGRFLSVDAVTENAENGANFNRYKYALNNPYRYTDPDGRCESISTCQMERDDRDLAAGRMTREEHRARIEARGIGVLAGVAILASTVGPQAPAVRRGLFTAGLEVGTQHASQRLINGSEASDVNIDKTDVAVAFVIGVFSPSAYSSIKEGYRHVRAIRALTSQSANTIQRFNKLQSRVQNHLEGLRTTLGAWIGYRAANFSTSELINAAEPPELEEPVADKP